MQIYRPYLAYFKAAIKRHWEGLTSIESRIQKTKRGLGNGRHNGNTVWTRRRPALPNSVQWSTAKLILFLHTYLFFVPIYFQVIHVNAHNCVSAIVVKIDFKWIILVLYGIYCFVLKYNYYGCYYFFRKHLVFQNCFQYEIILQCLVTINNVLRLEKAFVCCCKNFHYNRYLHF